MLCLGKPADVYLIDEPSAYLDSEQRLHAAKVIKRSVSSGILGKFVESKQFLIYGDVAHR